MTTLGNDNFATISWYFRCDNFEEIRNNLSREYNLNKNCMPEREPGINPIRKARKNF
jgi:hypothetical protein